MFKYSGEQLFDTEEMLVEVVTDIDYTREGFYSSIAKYAKHPTTGNRKTLDESNQNMIETFYEGIQGICNSDCTNLEKINILATLIIDEERKRIEFGDSLFEKKVLVASNDTREEITEQVEDMLIDQDYDEVFELYMQMHDQNIKDFFDEIDSTDKAKFIKRAENIGRFTLKVGKYAGLVSLGYLAHEIINK